MRMRVLAAVVGAFAFGGYPSAQDNPTAKPRYTSEAMLRRIAAGTPDGLNCVLPDKAERPVNTTVTVDGRTYRCAEILDGNFQRRRVAWTPDPPGKPPYTSEAMLRRIGAGTSGADALHCVLPDKAVRPVNTTVTVEGRTYRCIEVLDETFQRRGVGLMPEPPPFREK